MEQDTDPAFILPAKGMGGRFGLRRFFNGEPMPTLMWRSRDTPVSAASN